MVLSYSSLAAQDEEMPPLTEGFEVLKLSEIVPRVYTRHPFRRQLSTSTRTEYQQLDCDDYDANQHGQPAEAHRPDGLGLNNINHIPSTVKRVPVGSKRSSATNLTSPGLNLSPQSSDSRLNQGAFTQGNFSKSSDLQPTEWQSLEDDSRHVHQNDFSRNATSSEVNLIRMSHGGGLACPTDGDILTDPWSWFTIPVMILSFYSTIFSGIFLGIAFAKPRWGQRVGTEGHISFSTATLLSALFSKTIELSFVTVFVALLGQILSRRAFAKKSRSGANGISIADLSMRTWIMQPGSLITHWGAIRYAAISVLGGLALVATVAAMFYTTAAEALVSPKLKFGPTENRLLSGKVSASFANAPYLSETCQTPVAASVDEYERGNTCLQIENAGQSFHNFQYYLATWTNMLDIGNTSSTGALAGRPPPIAMLYDNTTVQGQWIAPSNENITRDSNKHQRLVQNLTMAMPHANIFNAVRDPINHILQPEDLIGSGEYLVNAGIPAPMINVLCVGMSADEVKPLIYSSEGDIPPTVGPTAVDDLFQFSNASGHHAPQFPKVPLEYNTLVNVSTTWGPDAVYLLAAPPQPPPSPVPGEFVLCSIKAKQYPNCTTSYHAAMSGGELSVHCNDDALNTIPYQRFNPVAPIGSIERDWKDVGSVWIYSISLPQGVSDSNASIARILTQMVPTWSPDTSAHLDPSLPSIGEALAVLAGGTLLTSTASSPFVHYWNYSDKTTVLPVPQYQSFNATLTYKDYASGGTQAWQGIFYVVLVAVFALDCFALCYLLYSFCIDGQVTDYTEPSNLFALAVNSPPSAALKGTCGAGPLGAVLGKKWCVDMMSPELGLDGEGRERHHHTAHPHFYVKCPDDEIGEPWQAEANRQQMRNRNGRRSRRPKSMRDFWVVESPAVEQYKRLSGK